VFQFTPTIVVVVLPLNYRCPFFLRLMMFLKPQMYTIFGKLVHFLEAISVGNAENKFVAEMWPMPKFTCWLFCRSPRPTPDFDCRLVGLGGTGESFPLILDDKIVLNAKSYLRQKLGKLILL
jgi:hypothetical protein